MNGNYPQSELVLVNGKYYLDNASTRPPKQETIDFYIQSLKEFPLNPHSSYNNYEDLISNYKRQLLAKLNLSPLKYDVIYTSGSSESLTTAIQSVFFNRQIISNKILYHPFEHSTVLKTLKYLENFGAELIPLPLNPLGLANLELISNVFNQEINTIICIDLHNETGLRNNINLLKKFSDQYDVPLISDSTQTILKESLIENLDFYFVSGHKLGTASSIGALIYHTKYNIQSIIHGSQQNNLRGGTLHLSTIANLDFVLNNFDPPHTSLLKDLALNLIFPKFKKVNFIAQESELSNSIIAIEIEEDKANILKKMDEFLFSFGSSCQSKIENKSAIYKHISKNEIIRISI